jgi:hypothetical protein
VNKDEEPWCGCTTREYCSRHRGDKERPKVTPVMRQAVRTFSAEARVVNAARKWRRMHGQPEGREKTSREQTLIAAIDELDAALRGPVLTEEPPDEPA